MIEKDNKTLWCGNLPDQATEELLYELFLQAGPLEKVRIARDRDGRQKNFAFITYAHEVSVPYAISLFRGTTLFNKTLMLQCRGRMPLLPPPIRSFGSEPVIDIPPNVAQQFANMTEQLNDRDHRPIHAPRELHDDKLVMASLQGNWNRHHPYSRSHDKPQHNRDDYRHRDNGGGQNRQHQGNWRDRRNQKRSNYHRQD